ncbi:glycosyltransferase family 2 protein [Mastigocladopsis repens]|uniref:glycosyltransferase family 2 protein n=1 Tax=Mastigocladopsis repens TaxID=221287 RepID=UPI0002F98904|nr:glycosyltransferase [Mastigocladopsis repens]
MVLISVVIPCYNAERFLGETVESVLRQTLANYEIILVDDGSTDGTAEVIKSFGARITVEFGPNRGASVARNRGTELAQGKFIQYLDADDLLRSDALERRVHALETNNADVAYSDWQRLEENEKGEFLPGAVIARKIEDVHPDPQIALFTDFWSPPAALLYRRQIVNAIGSWNESLSIIQDARFFLDAALMGANFVYVPEVGADYRVHKSNSLSKRNPRRFVEDVYRNACQVEAFWKANGGLTKNRCHALAKVYSYTARSLFMGEQDLFTENLHRLYQVEPGFRPSWSKIAGVASTLLGNQGAAILLKLLGRPPVYL